MKTRYIYHIIRADEDEDEGKVSYYSLLKPITDDRETMEGKESAKSFTIRYCLYPELANDEGINGWELLIEALEIIKAYEKRYKISPLT